MNNTKEQKGIEILGTPVVPIEAISKPIWDDNHIVDCEYECPKCHAKWLYMETKWLQDVQRFDTFNCTECGAFLKRI